MNYPESREDFMKEDLLPKTHIFAVLLLSVLICAGCKSAETQTITPAETKTAKPAETEADKPAVRNPSLLDRLFFYPDKKTYMEKARLPFDVKDVFFKSKDGTKLHAWLCKAKAGKVKGAVFHCHGNAQNLTSHIRLLTWLLPEGYHVFAWDYRGYGKSEGLPSKDGIAEDTRAAVKAFLDLPEIKDKGIPIIVLGQSLGAAYGSWIAAECPDAFDAVILEAPFTSHRDIAINVLARNPLTKPMSQSLGGQILKSGLDPIVSVAKIKVPLLVIHGKKDNVIPEAIGLKVHKAGNDPKELFSHGGKHLSYGTEAEKLRVHQGILDLLDKHMRNKTPK